MVGCMPEGLLSLLSLLLLSSIALDSAFCFVRPPAAPLTLKGASTFVTRRRMTITVEAPRLYHRSHMLAEASPGLKLSAEGGDEGMQTRVELSPPFMSRAQLERYVRTDFAIRILRLELPHFLDRPLTTDIYAANVTLGGLILGGTVASGRDELRSFFDNLRQLQRISKQGLLLRVASVEGDVTALASDVSRNDTVSNSLMSVINLELQWVDQLKLLSQLPGGELVASQLQPVLRNIVRDQDKLALTVRSSLSVDKDGRICELNVEQVLLNDSTDLVPAFVRWLRTVFTADLLRSAGASIELARAVAATLPGQSSSANEGAAGGNGRQTLPPPGSAAVKAEASRGKAATGDAAYVALRLQSRCFCGCAVA